MGISKEDIALQELRKKAWTGDAVLELYVRSWILKQYDCVDAPMKSRFICNQFLSCLGNPTKIEATVGEVYQAEGLEAAFKWIETHLQPLFLKQEAKRLKQAKGMESPRKR